MALADRFRHTLRALRHRNYRLFFSGQLVSLVGTWMTSVAMSWLVWRLTHSAFLLGAVAFASYVPAFLLGPIAGVLVDRFDKRRVVIATQVLAMVQSLLLAVLTLGGEQRVEAMLGLLVSVQRQVEIEPREPRPADGDEEGRHRLDAAAEVLDSRQHQLGPGEVVVAHLADCTRGVRRGRARIDG